MPHSYTKIYLHIVWATKNRERVLVRDARCAIQQHILAYAEENSILVLAMNVQDDHVHCLIDMKSNQQVDEIVKLFKGESSHWINERDLLPQKFSWQRGYGAFSVSPSHVENVKRYIGNQDEHHRRRSFAEEYMSILKKYGFVGVETDESVAE